MCELKNENFLIKNSQRLFSNKKLDSIQPYNFIRKSNYLSYDQINYYLERFVFTTDVVDIHTHLYPTKFSQYYKTGLLELLNYHYLVAEFLSASNFDPKRFYKLNNFSRAKLIWNELFLKRSPFSTSAMGILKILQKYEIKPEKIYLKKFYNEFKKNKLSENEILICLE